MPAPTVGHGQRISLYVGSMSTRRVSFRPCPSELGRLAPMKPRGLCCLAVMIVAGLAWAGSASASQGLYVTNLEASGVVYQYTLGTGGALTPDSTATASAGDGAFSIAISPNGQDVYAANGASTGAGGLSQYTVGTGGALTPDTTPTVTTGEAPEAVAVSPNGQYVYVANYGTGGPGTVSEYTVGTGGMLTADPTPTVSAGDTPYAVVVSPNGEYVYVADSTGDTISQYSVGASGMLTPDSTPTAPSGLYPSALAMSPNGQYLYSANYNATGTGGVSQYTVGTGGMLTPDTTPSVAAGEEPGEIAVSPNGRDVYVTNYGSTGADGLSQYTVGTGGMLSPDTTAAISTGSEPTGVEVSPDGQYVYVANSVSDTVSQYVVGTGGMLSPASAAPIAAGSHSALIAIAPDAGPMAAFAAYPVVAGAASGFASQSTGADEPVTTLTWNFGDGTTATGSAVNHTYAKAGTYTVTLTATDFAGCSDGFPFFSGEAGPFTGQDSACAPDPAAVTSKTVTIPAPAIVPSGSGTSGLGKFTVKGSKVAVTVSCAGTSAQTCSGKLALSTLEHLTGQKITAVTASKKKGKKTTHTVQLASASYSLTGRATKTLTLSLGKTGKGLLAKYHKLPAKLTVTPTGSKTAIATKTVTFTTTSNSGSLEPTASFLVATRNDPGGTRIIDLLVSGGSTGARISAICESRCGSVGRVVVSGVVRARHLLVLPLPHGITLVAGAIIELTAAQAHHQTRFRTYKVISDPQLIELRLEHTGCLGSSGQLVQCGRS
jgi:6-phosphogluconolactonase